MTLHEWFAQILLLFPHPYLVPFLGAVLGGEETILIMSALAAGGTLTFTEIFLLSYSGTIVSDWLWFLFGMRFASWLDRRPRIHAKLETVAGFVRSITRGRHFVALLITKFLYGTRIIMIFYLAKERLSFTRFSAYNAAVTGLWALVICSIGWFAGKGVTWIERAFSSVSLALGILLLFVIVLYGARIWLNRIIVEEEQH